MLEFLEGETLDARLARGSLNASEALLLATQIADALDQAHRLGIVHRDLKPGNVFLVRSTGSDIFAFGSLLYEMLTGAKAFQGHSQASLIGAILKDQITVVLNWPAAVKQ